MGKRFLIFILIIICFSFLICSSVSGANGNVLSKISKQQTTPDVSGNRVVWTDRRNDNKVAGGYNPDIYMRDDAGRIVPVCTNIGPQFNPKIYGNHIIWEDSRNGYHDIYVCDLKSYPHWLNDKQSVYKSKDLRVVNSRLIPRASGTYSLHRCNPDIYGNRVVWDDHNIYMYDLSTKKIKKVSPSSKQQDFPSIYGNIITWNDYRNIQGSITGYSDIYAFDLSKNKLIRVTPKTGYYGHPQVYGHFIFYWDGSGNHSYIYKYDLTTSSRKAILQNPGANFGLSGNKIVYVYYNGDKYFLYGDGGEIYIKNYQTDLLSNKGIPVCTENHTQKNPAISGGTIVWEDNRSGSTNIYLADYAAPKLTKAYPKQGSTIEHWCDYDDIGFVLYFNEIVRPGPQFAGISVKNLSNNKYLPLIKEFTSYLSYVPNRGETVWIWGPYTSTVWRSLKNVWCLLTVPAGAFKDINGNSYNKPIYIKVFITDTW